MFIRASASAALAASLMLAPLSCDGGGGAVPATRDWAANPAIVELPQPATLYAVSDVHGGYDRLMTLLVNGGVIEAIPASPSAVHWAAGDATLVVVGDLMDKGPEGIEVIEVLRALDDDAQGKGGHVVVLLGNHEAEFFADPQNSKADGNDGIDVELRHDNLDPAAFARSDPRAEWLAARPFGAKVGAWFFAHAGDTGGRSTADLAQAIEAGFAAHGWADDAITGDSSVLESRDWWSGDGIGARYAATLGVQHIVFGHDPHALGAEGAIVASSDGVLIRIDCGMSPDVDYSKGMLLRVKHQGSADVIEQISANGDVKPL